MQKLMDFLKYIIFSISLFAVISSLISTSIWLDMRIHASYVVYASFLIMALAFIVKRFQKLKEIKFLITMDILFLIVILFGKFDRISYELRDSFAVPIGIKPFKALIVIIFSIGNILIFINEKNNGVD